MIHSLLFVKQDRHVSRKCHEPHTLWIEIILLIYLTNCFFFLLLFYLIFFMSYSSHGSQRNVLHHAKWWVVSDTDTVHATHWQSWRGYSCTKHCYYSPAIQYLWDTFNFETQREINLSLLPPPCHTIESLRQKKVCV